MDDSLPELYTAHDIARAAGVAESQVRSLIESGAIHSVAGFLGKRGEEAWKGFVLHGEAVRAVRTLRLQNVLAAPTSEHLGLLLTSTAAPRRSTPFLVSTSLHALAAVLLFVGSLGLTSADEKTEPTGHQRQTGAARLPRAARTRRRWRWWRTEDEAAAAQGAAKGAAAGQQSRSDPPAATAD